MKKSLLAAAFLVLALSSCGKNSEATATSTAPAAQPILVGAVPAAAAVEGANASNSGTGLKLDNVQVPAAPVAGHQPEQK